MILSDEGIQPDDYKTLRHMIAMEDKEQIDKWGHQQLHPFEWLAYMTEELGEVSEAMSEHIYRSGDPQKIIDEAIQLATLSLKVALMMKKLLNNVHTIPSPTIVIESR